MAFTQISALYLNCTLKRTPEMSHTDGLIEKSRKIMADQGVSTDIIRPVDCNLAFGVQPDMREHGWEKDDWPQLFEKILKADILIIGSPIWLGAQSSVSAQLIERLYGNSGQTNAHGQSIYYGRTAGVLVTGNEDGGKHVCRNIIYSLQHIGFTIPPQAEAYWVGDAGPGPSYKDEGSGGPENDFTNKNVRIMSWNLMHFAALLKEKGGIPPQGNTQEG